MTVHPESNKINVFNDGISQGLNVRMPLGGHEAPISIEGETLLWKNAQKKAKKNKTSEIINKIIPKRNPCCTIPVWCPSNVDSRTTSLHQTNITKSKLKNPNKSIKDPYLNAWKYNTPPIVLVKAANEATNGHGLGSTKWNGWRW